MPVPDTTPNCPNCETAFARRQSEMATPMPPCINFGRFIRWLQILINGTSEILPKSFVLGITPIIEMGFFFYIRKKPISWQGKNKIRNRRVTYTSIVPKVYFEVLEHLITTFGTFLPITEKI
jgi:hypothetical protein